MFSSRKYLCLPNRMDFFPEEPPHPTIPKASYISKAAAQPLPDHLRHPSYECRQLNFCSRSPSSARTWSCHSHLIFPMTSMFS